MDLRNRDRGTTCTIGHQLPTENIASIRFDFNGHGESEGRFEDMTVPNEIEDAKCVYQYVSTLPFIDTKTHCYTRASQGGVVASMTAGESWTRQVESRRSPMPGRCPPVTIA